MDTPIPSPNSDDRLLEALRARVAQEGTAPPAATAAEIVRAEEALGFPLSPLYRRVLSEVADGGFGPGYGLIGVGEGGRDGRGRTLVDLRRDLDAPGLPLPAPLVAMCEWGDSMWSCVDCEDDQIVTLDEHGATATGQSLSSWLRDWLDDVPLFEKTFSFCETKGINPFTKQPMTSRSVDRAIGTPYRARR